MKDITYQDILSASGCEPEQEQTQGRPSKYNPHETPRQAYVACSEMGARVGDLAKLFGVNERTIWHWQQNHPIFRQAIKIGRDEFDTQKVEKSLLQRALGYEYVETRTEEISLRGEAGEGIEVRVPATRVITTVRQQAPDVMAQMFWLQNRQSDRWKNVRSSDGAPTQEAHLHFHKHIEQGKLDVSQLSDQELKALHTLQRKVLAHQSEESSRE